MGEYCSMLGTKCPHEAILENQCFLIMTYKRDKKLEETFNDVIKNVYGLTPVIAKRVKIRGSKIMFCEKICLEIRKSLICFADVSRDNVNVGFEFGLACGFKKPTFYTMNERLRRYPPSDLAALTGLWYRNYAQLKRKMIGDIDLRWLNRIKREKNQEKKMELLCKMLEKYRAKPPPVV